MDTVADDYALSPMQKGMLFHHLVSPQPGIDVEQMVCDLRESLNPALFKRAWEQVVSRHPALRTRFRWEGLDEPVQEVLGAVELPWDQGDWRGLTHAEQDARLAAFLKSDRERGFDLSCAPFIRLSVFQREEAFYQAVWTCHHSMLDGGSYPMLLREVFAFYEAFAKGEALTLPEPPPYRGYIDWVTGPRDLSASEAYWRGLLEGFSTPTPLVVDHGVVPDEGGYGMETARLSADALAALNTFAKANGSNLNTMVQGAWALLLSRYSGESDVVFGAIRAGRHFPVEGSAAMVGLFINTLPVRARFAPDKPLMETLSDLRGQSVAIRPHEHTPLLAIQGWSEVPNGTPLFDSILIFDGVDLSAGLRAPGGAWANRSFFVYSQTNFALMLRFSTSETNEGLIRLSYDRQRLDAATVRRMVGHLRTLLENFPANPEARPGDVPLLTAEEQAQLLGDWNATAADYPRDRCVHQLFEEQARRTPDAPAVVFRGSSLTYRELNRRANRVAHHLVSLGVGPGTLVGVCVSRSLEMMPALLGILKAGGAYVPLDPEYPAERLALMVEDSGLSLLLTEEALVGRAPAGSARVVRLDADRAEIARQSDADPAGRGVTPADLAYVIYTSGSTGRPKGVMVEHRNVVNFFAGMDERLDAGPGAWMAVTSLSFDISVLELFWTLARGFKVVLHEDSRLGFAGGSAAASPNTRRKPVDFSLFYFASDAGQGGPDAYRLLMEGAKFADRNGFAAVWTPERHFHAFGGLYPNPSVAAAAIAAVTERIAIRAGSCVSPLHHPLRIAEEWAMVDNLSGGRVGISFAAGWQPNDFVLSPENFADRKGRMFRDIDTVQRLWRGEAVEFSGADGAPVPVRTLPRPLQPELPIWLTAAGNPETFRTAGERGASVLTHLLGQSVEELSEKLAIYRDARRAAGHAGDGHVTLMLHTFVGDDEARVRELVRQPMKDYLASSMDLIRKAAWSFPALRSRAEETGRDPGEVFDSKEMTPEVMDALLDHAFERYYRTGGLFGTPESCADLIDRLKSVGVDEIACLIDFGVPTEEALAGLVHLNALRERANPALETEEEAAEEDYSLPAQMRRHGVTHLQCTPSFASMLLLDDAARDALRPLRNMMVGGEALPPALARQLVEAVSGQVVNMYGPTETTIWSSTHAVKEVGTSVSIGTPVANTQLYVLDAKRNPVPVGVPGELYIGGDGVVRGYLDRPELTAERFVPDPFSGTPGARLYRTGDLVRWLPNGTVEFLGRVDFQVKIRGHRIELGEIEALLTTDAAVSEAVVVAREDNPGDVRLVAYVLAARGGVPSPKGLRALLQEKLPDYMVPSVVVPLDAFPLTPNGKVDRRALPRPDLAEAGSSDAAGFAAPATAVEEALAGFWTEALGVGRIGRSDDFFALGGHSLSAVQIAFRIRQAFEIDFPLQAFFRVPTLAGQAEIVEEKLLAQAEAAELAALLAEMEQLSEEDARQLVSEKVWK